MSCVCYSASQRRGTMRRPVAFMFGLSLIVIVKVHCDENIEPVINRMNDLSGEVAQVKMNLGLLEMKVINQIDLAKLSLGIELKRDMNQHVRDAMAEILRGESIDEMVRSLTVSVVKQLKRENKQLKTQLYHVIRDVQKEREETFEKAGNQSPELKCIVYTEATGTDNKVSNSFINSQLELVQSVSNLTWELQSIKMEKDTLNISVSATREDLMSARSEMKMNQVSVNVIREDLLSMKSELTQVQASLNNAEQDILSTKSDMKMVPVSVNVTGKKVPSMKPELIQVQAILNAALRDISSTKSEITAVNTSLSLVRKGQRITTSRLSVMNQRIAQVENALNTLGALACGDPPKIANTAVSQGSYVIGSTRNYACNPGYIGWNSAQVTCLPNGTWSGASFYCTRIAYDYTPDPVSGEVFKLIETMTWNQGRQLCQAEGGDLLKILNETHLQFFEETFKSIGIVDPPGLNAVIFVGASDIDEEGDWKWLDGTSVNSDLWSSISPDNYYDNEDCAVVAMYAELQFIQRMKMGDVLCGAMHRCLCSKRSVFI